MRERKVGDPCEAGAEFTELAMLGAGEGGRLGQVGLWLGGQRWEWSLNEISPCIVRASWPAIDPHYNFHGQCMGAPLINTTHAQHSQCPSPSGQFLRWGQ